MPACSRASRVLLAALALAGSGAGSLGCQREVPVLLYHAVGCGTADPLDVPVEQFEAQLDDVARRGYRFVPLSELVAGWEHGARQEKVVALTFDDGPACLFSAAFPVLRRRRIPFTLFLTEAWLGGE